MRSIFDIQSTTLDCFVCDTDDSDADEKEKERKMKEKLTATEKEREREKRNYRWTLSRAPTFVTKIVCLHSHVEKKRERERETRKKATDREREKESRENNNNIFCECVFSGKRTVHSFVFFTGHHRRRVKPHFELRLFRPRIF
jgi:hypothetical protein